MKRLYSAFSYRNSIILVLSVFILFFLIVSGLPSSSNPVISTTAVEANAEPSVTPPRQHETLPCGDCGNTVFRS
jgi:hypothetical protein